MPDVATAALMGVLLGLFAGMGLGWYARGWAKHADKADWIDELEQEYTGR